MRKWCVCAEIHLAMGDERDAAHGRSLAGGKLRIGSASGRSSRVGGFAQTLPSGQLARRSRAREWLGNGEFRSVSWLTPL